AAVHRADREGEDARAAARDPVFRAGLPGRRGRAGCRRAGAAGVHAARAPAGAAGAGRPARLGHRRNGPGLSLRPADDALAGDALSRRRHVRVARAIPRPLPARGGAARPLADAVIEAARASMATRARELHAFARPNPGDVLVADPGRGLRIALVGLQPDDRLPLDAYYAYLAFRNGVPVSYGGGWGCLGTLEFALNIFESFRQGESALVIGQILRVYYQLF